MNHVLLSRHAHFCVRGDAVVFLDLHRDAYTMLNGTDADLFYRLSAAEIPHSVPECGALRSKLLAKLVGSGLLTTDSRRGKPILATRIELATQPLRDPDETLPGVWRTADLTRFTEACISTFARLRMRSIESTISRIERRKATHGNSRLDIAKARAVTQLFETFRPFFPLNYLCLFDSVALVEFLAQYGVYPTLVFGIRLEPWAAHCWVQEGTYSFNENVEEAAAYTPIMAV